MSLSSEHIDELIAKQLAGEASSEEIALLENWKREHADNEKYFEDFTTIFNRSEYSSSQIVFDTDSAWAKVRAKILDEPTGKIVALQKRSWFTPLRVAASVALLIGIAAVYYFMIENQQPQFALKSTMEILRDSLPDGSIAVLNKNSSLTYSLKKKEGRRVATLAGEAYFEVVHDAKQIFVVETQGVFIQDIGTAFNIRSNAESDTIEVFVSDGEVKFYSATSQGMNLAAGETGYYLKSSRRFEKKSFDDEDGNSAAYANRKFNFRNATLGRVARKLNEVYDTRLELSSEALATCRISVKFDNEEIETIAAVIAETLNLEMRESGGLIVLSGEGCE